MSLKQQFIFCDWLLYLWDVLDLVHDLNLVQLLQGEPGQHDPALQVLPIIFQVGQDDEVNMDIFKASFLARFRKF